MPAGACTSSCVRHKQQQSDPRDANAIFATLHELLCLPAALFQSRQRMHAKQNFPILTRPTHVYAYATYHTAIKTGPFPA